LNPRLTTLAISRGDVVLVDLGTTVGAETCKIRPCIVIQNDIANATSPVTIVVIMVSYKGKKLFPGNVLLRASETGLNGDSVVLINQIRTVDKTRLIKKLGRIPDDKIRLVDMAIICHLDLDYT